MQFMVYFQEVMCADIACGL